MPEHTEETKRNKITISLPHVGGAGGILSLIVCLAYQMFPGLVTDKEAINAEVGIILAQRVESAEDKVNEVIARGRAIEAEAREALKRIDEKIDNQVGELKDTLKDKVKVIRELLGGLKDLFEEKSKQCISASGRNEKDIQNLERQVQRLEDELRGIEVIIEAGVSP